VSLAEGETGALKIVTLQSDVMSLLTTFAAYPAFTESQVVMTHAVGNKNRLHDVIAPIASQSADWTILVVDDEPGIVE
jgi:hypothetical protein